MTVATGLSVLSVLSGEYPLLESLILGQMTLGIWVLYPTMVYTFMFWAIGRLERPEERAQVGCFRPSSSVILSRRSFVRQYLDDVSDLVVRRAVVPKMQPV